MANRKNLWAARARLLAWNWGDDEGLPAGYEPDAWDFQQDLTEVLKMALAYLESQDGVKTDA